MSRRLPPLNALRAFEAAARHLSFTKAAAELHVTPAAISHQIRALEDELGTPLFRRLTRAIRLTEAGQAALPALRDAFACIEEAIEAARAPQGGSILTVTTSPSFASKWLVPRLDRFHDAHPEIDLRIHTTEQVVDLARHGIDLALRYGRGDYPGNRVLRLFGEEVFPVCSPALVEGDNALRRTEDLARATLIHHEIPWAGEAWPTWRMWLLAAGLGDLDADRGSRFTHGVLAIQAAVAGQGVALGTSVLAATELADGRLVRPFALALPGGFSYWLVVPQRLVDQPRVQAFRAWVLAEAGAVETALPPVPATT